MKSGCARCGFGICSPWVWVLLIVGFIFIFFLGGGFAHNHAL